MRAGALRLLHRAFSFCTEPRLLPSLLVAHLAMALGVAWDIHWHAVVGRQSFWIAPHMLLYPGAAVAGTLAFLAVWKAKEEKRPYKPATTLPFRLPPGYGAIALGSAAMVVAAGFDELWHRTIGDRTVWSPPHVMAVTGGVIITLGIAVAIFHARRRRILPTTLSYLFVLYLFATLLDAAYFGLMPAALHVFLPDGSGLTFFTASPYLLAGMASLLIPGMMACCERVLGRGGFDRVALVAIILWGTQAIFRSAATPRIAAMYGYAIVAGASGYAVKPFVRPGLGFELLVLGFMLIPALLVNRVVPRARWAGIVLAATYVIAIAVYSSLLAAGGVAGWPPPLAGGMEAIAAAPIVVVIGVASSGAGMSCGRWISGAFAGVQ